MNKHYQKYKRTIKKSVLKWQKENPEKAREYRCKSYENFAFGRRKDVILSRDNYQCQICGMSRKEHYKKYSKDLEIHHIDGNGINKKKIDKNNDLDNLITLCCKCHKKIDGWKIREKKWSRKFDKCVMCGTVKRGYGGNGLCTLCYEKEREEYKRVWYKKKLDK